MLLEQDSEQKQQDKQTKQQQKVEYSEDELRKKKKWIWKTQESRNSKL